MAARTADMNALDREKSLLIRSINYSLRDDNFYEQPIAEYRMYATIQTLLNEWRKPVGTADLSSLAKYEDHLRSWLLSEKKTVESGLIDESPGTARLLMRVMMKKLNEKYSNVLNDEQRELIKAYAFSTANDDQTTIKRKLEEMRSDLLNSIEEYETNNQDNTFLVKKLNEAKTAIVSESLETVNDSTVSKFMLYSALRHELISSEGENQ
jgi:hypothetical protein